jgi:hypothetical protein
MLAERMKFTRASFRMIETYVATAVAAARDADYGAAVRAGTDALKPPIAEGIEPLIR